MAPTPTPSSAEVAAADAHFRSLVCELCAQLFTTGAATGTGGGMCVLEGGRLYVAPSGVPKERIAPADVFVVSPADAYAVVVPPASRGLSLSACLPLFALAIERRGAGAVVHSHSVTAVMAGLLAVRPVGDADGGVRGGVTEVFQVSHLEMLKGLWWGGRDAAANARLAAGGGRKPPGGRHGRCGYEDTLTIPVIRNTPYESQLVTSMADAMDAGICTAPHMSTAPSRLCNPCGGSTRGPPSSCLTSPERDAERYSKRPMFSNQLVIDVWARHSGGTCAAKSRVTPTALNAKEWQTEVTGTRKTAPSRVQQNKHTRATSEWWPH